MIVWDVVRVVIIVLYGLSLGETAFIIKKYFGIIAATRRLLPAHVVSIGCALLGFEGLAVWQNIVRIGTGFSFYAPINLVLFSVTYAALFMMRVHITRKKTAHDKISSLIDDRRMTP